MALLFNMNYILLIIISLIVTRKMFGVYLLPNTIFTLIWSTCGILSTFKVLEIIQPSPLIHVYTIIAIISFNIAYLFGAQDTKKNEQNCDFQYVVNVKLLYLLNILAFVAMLPNLISSMKIIIASGFNLFAVRYNVYVLSGVESNIFEIYLTRIFPNIIFTGTLLIAVSNFVRKNKQLLVTALLGVIASTLTYGGRYELLNAITFYIAFYLIDKNHLQIKLKKKYLLIMVIGLFAVTQLRGTNGMTIFEMFYFYFPGSFSMLEAGIRNPELLGLNEVPLFGYLTLGFILGPIALILKLLIGLNIEVPSYYFNIYAQKMINIGDGSLFYTNNNATMLYTFLRDFGEIGVIIGPFFLALLMTFFQDRHLKKNDYRSYLILAYLYTIIISSPMMYGLTTETHGFIIAMIMVVVKKKRLHTSAARKVQISLSK